MESESLESEIAEPTSKLSTAQPSDDSDSLVDSMSDYYQLTSELFVILLALTAFFFLSVWIAYSLNVALNYLLGALVGAVYLRMLARDVEQLGISRGKLSKTRLALFIAVVVVATQVDRLEVLPVFLGFLTYKAALLFYVIRSLAKPNG